MECTGIVESNCGLLKEMICIINCWWKEETLKMQPNNLLNLKMCSHIFKIKFYLIPSLSMVLGRLVKRPTAGPPSKSFHVHWGLSACSSDWELNMDPGHLYSSGSFFINWSPKLELGPHQGWPKSAVMSFKLLQHVWVGIGSKPRSTGKS